MCVLFCYYALEALIEMPLQMSLDFMHEYATRTCSFTFLGFELCHEKCCCRAFCQGRIIQIIMCSHRGLELFNIDIIILSRKRTETGSMTGILEELKWETLQKRMKDNRLILLYKGLKGKARIPTDDLFFYPKEQALQKSTLVGLSDSHC